MIVNLEENADADAVQRALIERGLWVRSVPDLRDRSRVQLLVEGGSAAAAPADLLSIDGVASVGQCRSEHPLLDEAPPVVEVQGIRIGPGADPVVIAGPCSVESEEHIHGSAARLSGIGVRFLRGGAFKPRSSPYTFQGHGLRALRWMRRAADAHHMLVVTEALGVEHLEKVAEAADILQVGSRNMHNTPLLCAVGAMRMPVLLKRGMAATVDEWLEAAEYCLLHGAAGVVFCERGIRGFDPNTRNVLDLGAVALLAHVHRRPVLADPSHAAGRRDLLLPLSRAALAAGAAGVMLEIHDDPGRALSDGPQALRTGEVATLIEEVNRGRVVPSLQEG